MAVAHALAVTEILQHILQFDVLSRGDHARFTLVSRTWRPSATEALWRDLPGLEPFLCLLPSKAYLWTSQRGRAYGRRTLKLTLDLNLTDDLRQVVLERSRMTRRLTLTYDRFMVDASIREAIAACVDAPMVSFLPRVHTITIETPWDFFRPEDMVYLPRSLGRCSGVRASFDVKSIVNLLPNVSAVFVGGPVLDPLQHLRVLHIRGLPLVGLIDVMTARSSWLVDELCIETDEVPDASELDVLLVAIAQACGTIHRLYICLHEFEDDQPWIITPTAFRPLTMLLELIDLRIVAPLTSRLSDSDWEEVITNWPSLESLCIIPGSDYAWRYVLPLVSGATPACTALVVAYIARACPLVHTLVLPGMNCRSIPSLSQVRAVYGHKHQRFGHALQTLGVYDSPLVDPGALGSVLCLLFPALKAVTYKQFPRALWADADVEARIRGGAGEEFGPQGWKEVNEYVQARWDP